MLVIPMNRTVFVDFDGTIVDVFPRYYGILSSYLEKYTDKKMDYDTYRKMKKAGNKDNQIVEKILGIKIDIMDYLSYKSEMLEDPRWLKKDIVFGDPKDAYDKLKEIKYNVVLLTQRNKEDNFYRQINDLKIRNCFDDLVILKPCIGRNVKTDYISAHYHKENIVIGDSKTEIEAAKMLNIEGYFVETGLFSSCYVGIKEFIFDNYNIAVEYLYNLKK